MWGAGGCGGLSGGSGSCYGGGGGGLAISEITSLTPGDTVAVTVGAGCRSYNGVGGTSSFGSFLSATGGNAGDNSSSNQGSLNLWRWRPGPQRQHRQPSRRLWRQRQQQRAAPVTAAAAVLHLALMATRMATRVATAPATAVAVALPSTTTAANATPHTPLWVARALLDTAHAPKALLLTTAMALPVALAFLELAGVAHLPTHTPTTQSERPRQATAKVTAIWSPNVILLGGGGGGSGCATRQSSEQASCGGGCGGPGAGGGSCHSYESSNNVSYMTGGAGGILGGGGGAGQYAQGGPGGAGGGGGSSGYAACIPAMASTMDGAEMA